LAIAGSLLLVNRGPGSGQSLSGTDRQPSQQVGPSIPTAVGPGPTTVAVGQAMVPGDGRSATVVRVERPYLNPHMSAPPAGQECVLVYLDLANTSATTVWPVSMREFDAVDATGHVWQADVFNPCAPLAPLTLINPRDTLSTFRSFTVPAGAVLTLTWVPNVMEAATYRTPLR
jgi:hypothetical protein